MAQVIKYEDGVKYIKETRMGKWCIVPLPKKRQRNEKEEKPQERRKERKERRKGDFGQVQLPRRSRNLKNPWAS